MRTLIFISLLVIASCTQAEQLFRPFTVKQVFAEGVTGAGFYPNEALSECQYGLMYISLANDGGKAIFSLVIAAKAAGQTIARIDYTVSASGACTASGLHVR